MKPRNDSQVVCPKCGHLFSQPKLKSEISVDKPSHCLRCIECSQPITGAPLSFGGVFACESCVTAYYQQQGPEVVKLELRERTFTAARLLRRRKW
jgi:hypothetical protein